MKNPFAGDVKSGKYVVVDAKEFYNFSKKMRKATGIKRGTPFNLTPDDLNSFQLKQATRLSTFASNSKVAAVTVMVSMAIGASVGALLAIMNDKKRRALRSHQ